MVKYDSLNAHDIKVLRGLGEWKARASETPENREKIQAWIRHDSDMTSSRAMVLAETDYLAEPPFPVGKNDLLCTGPWARDIELSLRQLKYEIETLRDDHMALPYMEYAPHVAVSDFGVPSGIHHETGADSLAFQYRPQLKNLDEQDFSRLHDRTFVWDRDADEADRERLESVFGNILNVRRRNNGWQLVMPMTSTCLELVGLDGFMVLMCENPEGVHRLMRLIRDNHLAMLQFYKDNKLLELNNEADYIGSGCMGYSKELPSKDFSGTVRPNDLWYYCESQESIGIGPDMFGEFVFPYIKDIACRFGRVYYGCCEPVNPFFEYLASMDNLKRVSVSPWADEPKVGEFCREKKIVYSRKPRPTLFMDDTFNELAVREHLEYTMSCAQGCSLEFIQRDVINANHHPERFVRWVELVREVTSRFGRGL